MKFEPLLKAAPFSGTRVRPFDGTKQYLSTGDLQDDSLSFVDVTFKDKPSRADIAVREGDVLFARMKATKKVLRVTQELAGTIVSTGFAVLRPSEDCDPAYLATYLRTDYFERQKEKYCSGAIQPAITNGGIEKLQIPLPPVHDQIRIADLLGKVERLIAQRKQHLQQLDDLLKSVFLVAFGDPVRNEKGWATPPLVDLTAFITDGKHGDCKNDEGSGYFFISAKDIHDGIIDYSKARQISKDEFEEVHRRTNLQTNDLVMVNTGATIGKMAIARSDPKTAVTTFQKSVAVIKPIHDVVNVVYLKALFEIRLRALVKVSSGSAQQNLLLSQMRKIPVMLPPIALQNQFAAIVENIEALKSRFRQTFTDLEALYGALSQQAFKGELDLSRVALLAAPIERESPVAASMPTPITTPVIELPETDLLLAALQDRTQLATLLRLWLEAYRTQLGSAAFSFELFIAAARTRLAELHPDNDFEWAASEYEYIKAWVFEALAAGALTQAFDDEGNRIELRAAAVQSLA